MALKYLNLAASKGNTNAIDVLHDEPSLIYKDGLHR